MNEHEKYMRRVFALAKKGWGRTNPNPLVGALLVKNGQMIATGYHAVVGGEHAEVIAIRNAKGEARGSALYVNLEPCCHQGRTPPCTDAIIRAGIDTVVIAMKDPNPLVSGRGIKQLQNAGIQTVTGVLEKQAVILNEIFITYIRDRKPFVMIKTAMTLDGKIASVSSMSKWISSKRSRQYVHTIRDRISAIMVGSNTVQIDNPALTTRLKRGKEHDPIRIIVDGKGRISPQSQAINNESKAGVILATTDAIDLEKERSLIKKGVRILKLQKDDGHVDLMRLTDACYDLGIDSILIEGGGGLNAAALKAHIVDKVMFFIAPKIIGGQTAVTPVEGEGLDSPVDAIDIYDMQMRRFGDDILVQGYVKGEPCLRD